MKRVALKRRTHEAASVVEDFFHGRVSKPKHGRRGSMLTSGGAADHSHMSVTSSVLASMDEHDDGSDALSLLGQGARSSAGSMVPPGGGGSKISKMARSGSRIYAPTSLLQ